CASTSQRWMRPGTIAETCLESSCSDGEAVVLTNRGQRASASEIVTLYWLAPGTASHSNDCGALLTSPRGARRVTEAAGSAGGVCGCGDLDSTKAAPAAIITRTAAAMRARTPIDSAPAADRSGPLPTLDPSKESNS